MAWPYPRPQLVRKHWTPLNGPWRFLFDEARKFRQPFDIPESPLEIRVPLPPEPKSRGIGDADRAPKLPLERIADITRMSSSHIHGGV